MARASLSVLVVALTTAACTVVSGVDDMELRSGDSPAPTQAQDGNAPPTNNPFSAPDAGGAETSADKTPGAGPKTCGSQGSWSACVAALPVTTCAAICASQGRTCVNSCCAFDQFGSNFTTKAGMVFVLKSECSINAITDQATFGSCTDTMLDPAGLTDARCCCQ